MNGNEFLQQAHGLKSQTDMADYVSLGDQRRMWITVPEMGKQRSIATNLGALDDKIALNRQMNQTLEQIAAALFRSWFVDFDPVRAKAVGRQPEGMDAETAALFPDRLVESEIGEIPEGWDVLPVGEVVTAVGGSTPPTGEATFWGGDIPFATPKDLSKLDSPILLATERFITDAGLARISSGLIPRHSVLMSSRAPIGYLAVNDVPVSVNQGMIVMISEKGVSPWFMLGWARTNMEEIVGRANGTTFLEISKRNFRPIPLLLPSRPIRDAFDAVAKPLYERITANLRQNETLSELRDSLLPKLLSGDLPVPISAIAEEIV
jgi:type I restriction enzyme S subunit